MTDTLQHITDAFTAVSLKEMQRVSLLHRVEQKFLLPQSRLPQFMATLKQSHYILSVNGTRNQQYTTCYYDTDAFSLYLDHHNGKPNRVKIRRRRYEETGACFFEVKRKVKGIRTEKERIVISGLDGDTAADEISLLHQAGLHGQLWQQRVINKFHRITLCDSSYSERITIDTGISVAAAGITKTIDHVALIEVKQPSFGGQSMAIRTLRDMGCHGGPFSKYALGVSLLYPQQKSNNFKPLILKLNKYAH